MAFMVLGWTESVALHCNDRKEQKNIFTCTYNASRCERRQMDIAISVIMETIRITSARLLAVQDVRSLLCTMDVVASYARAGFLNQAVTFR